MKIVVLDGYCLNPGDLSWDGFEKLGEFTCYERTPESEVASRIGDADIVITNKTPVTAKTISSCPNIRYIGVLATGYNIVDTEAASAKGIVVSNVPTYGTFSVAQFVFAMLLEICHHIGHHSLTVAEGKWSQCKDYCYWDYPLMELCGKTLGIIGYGQIGRATAKIAVAMGMNVLANARHRFEDEDDGMIKYAELDDVLKNSDVISLHCPLFESTKNMINKDTISKMKDKAILINTSRGPLVCEQDVYDALESGKLGYYAADVVSTEPIESDNVLLKAKNCIITPHIAWAPIEARKRLMDTSVANLEAFVSGKPQNVVNK